MLPLGEAAPLALLLPALVLGSWHVPRPRQPQSPLSSDVCGRLRPPGHTPPDRSGTSGQQWPRAAPRQRPRAGRLPPAYRARPAPGPSPPDRLPHALDSPRRAGTPGFFDRARGLPPGRPAASGGGPAYSGGETGTAVVPAPDTSPDPPPAARVLRPGGPAAPESRPGCRGAPPGARHPLSRG